MYWIGSLAIAILIAANIGSAGLGLFRTVQLLFGPVQLLTIGAEMVFLPYLVRAMTRTLATGVGESGRYSLVMAGSIAAYGLILVVVAPVVLTKVFGTAYAAANVLVVPMLVACTLDALWSGPALFLRARAKGARLLVGQAAYTTVRVGAVTVLVGVAGLRGAGWGLAIGSGVAAFVFWTQIVLATTEERRHPDAVERKVSSLPHSVEAGGA